MTYNELYRQTIAKWNLDSWNIDTEYGDDSFPSLATMILFEKDPPYSYYRWWHDQSSKPNKIAFIALFKDSNRILFVPLNGNRPIVIEKGCFDYFKNLDLIQRNLSVEHLHSFAELTDKIEQCLTDWICSQLGID